MSSDAALLLLSVATAFLFISVRSTCRNPVHCSCGITGENLTTCGDEQNSKETDPCTRWPDCRRCGEGFSCLKGTNQTLRSRRKRYYATYGKERRPSYPTGLRSRTQRQPIARSEPRVQYGGDCSENIETPKLGGLRCVSGRGRKTCTGTCLPGYTFENQNDVNEMELSCQNGRWMPARSFPACVSGGHCDLVVMGHGRFNCTTEMHGTRCDVFCATRYAGRFNCYPGTPWEPTLPRCVRPKGGESGTGEVRQPCRCEYGASCDRDGRCICPAGRTGTLCESIIADKQACNDPGFISHGHRRNQDGTDSRLRRIFQDGESVVFGCRSNTYALQGSTFITCRDGQWSESLPRCIQSTVTPAVNCPNPSQVADADRLNTDGSSSQGVQSYRPGQSVVYTCRSGYALHGPSLITCQTSGLWSSSLPHCMPIRSPAPVIQTTTGNPDRRSGISFCRDPGRVLNGNRAPAPHRRGFPQGSRLEYSCNQGYALQGEDSIFCLVGGRWSSTPPRCGQQPGGEGEYCLNPGRIQNGRIVYYPNTNSQRGSEDNRNALEYAPGVRLVYSCDEGYQLQGSSEMTCRGDTGLWSTYPPTCQPDIGSTSELVYCDDPGNPDNGRRTHFPSLNSRSPQGSSEDTRYPEGTRFEYSCDVGYIMRGLRSQRCEKGYWSAPKPTCERVSTRITMYCDNPGPLTNGRVRPTFPTTSRTSEDDLEYPEDTQLAYSCEDGFTLIGSSALTCLPTSHWSSDPPMCLAECGISSAMTNIRLFNGTRTHPGEWPWVVAIRENNRSRIMCGGAVLNRRTVVTAAHCLTGSDSYLLYFGKVQRLDQDDDDKVMVRRSSRIILHPDYSEAGMESDIGLVHFSDPIRFTDRIQPICLPDGSSTAKNIQPGSIGYVTGFGDNERGVQPSELMQARVPVQDNEVCVEYYQRQRITLVMSQNMFCAGHLGGVQATCQGDSGSAVVFFDRSAQHFVLEGLVSFGTNGQCGLQGWYTVFTKVFPFVPWLLVNLA